ncbi:hypothetical protein BG000_004797 [Podila horticola]|nr:hypothetical protein BG000_004797 [Podila horticola]
MANHGMVISTPPIGSSSTLTTPIQHKPPPVQHNYTVITNTNTAFNASDAVNISPAALVKCSNKPTSASSSSVASLLKLGDNLHPSLHPNHRPNTANKNGYVSRVGFDTLGCNDTAEYAFTLQAKTDGWRRCKKSRTFLVGTDLNEYSAHALSWTMENMLEDGDELVALRVVPVELRDSLSKTKIPSFHGQEAAAREEAAKIMSSIMERTSSKKISIVVECMVGNVRETIQHMTKLYQPDMLIVGTRGRSSVKGFLLGSVSRYCLHHSTVPVIVVRPERKLNKSKTKTKGIFGRRSSDQPGDQGYHPIQTPIDLLGSANSSTNTLASNNINNPNSNNNSPSTPGIALFPSNTVAVGESFSSRNNYGSGNRPRSSIFESSTSTPLYSNSPPPPDGVLKMKKSLTSDGSTPSKSNRKSTGFLSLSLGGNKDKDKEKEKEKEKEKDGSGFTKSNKRHSHGG